MLGCSLLFRITYIRAETHSLEMDSEPVRIVFLTERDDEAIQCRVQDYRFMLILKIHCQDPQILINVRVFVNNNFCFGGEEMRSGFTGNSEISEMYESEVEGLTVGRVCQLLELQRKKKILGARISGQNTAALWTEAGNIFILPFTLQPLTTTGNRANSGWSMVSSL